MASFLEARPVDAPDLPARPPRSNGSGTSDGHDSILDERVSLAPFVLSIPTKKGQESSFHSESSRENEGLGKLNEELTELIPHLKEQIDREEGQLTVHLKMSLRSSYQILQQLSAMIAMELSANDDKESVLASHGCPSEISFEVGDDLQRQKSNRSLIYDSVCSGPSSDEIYGGDSPVRSDGAHKDKIDVKRISLSDGRKMNQLDSLETTSSTFSSRGEATTSKNKCYIHPEKPFRLSWDFTALMLILIVSIVVPVELSFFFDDAPPLFLQIISELIDGFFALDIFLNFFTAHHEGHGLAGQLVTDHKGIALHYLRGWLFLDVIATFPYMRVVSVAGGEEGDNQGVEAVTMIKMLKYAKIARVMKVLRVLKLGGLMQSAEEKMVAQQSMTVAFQLMKMTTVMFILCHNVACFWYWIHGQAVSSGVDHTWLIAQGLENADGGAQYIAAFYFSITTGTTVGYGDIHPENTAEQAIASILLVAAVGYIGQFLGRVSHIVNSLRQQENQTAQSKREALIFMTRRQVPKLLQFKVLRYIEHTSENTAVTFLDSRILKHLSDSLQNELAFAITGNIFRAFPLFEDADEDFLTALCSVGQTKRAGIGDLVVAEEQVAHEMFWIVRGEARVVRRGQLINILRGADGDWFGELALFFPGAIRAATVRCETHCEFLVLHHDDFQVAMSKFPHVKRQYDKLAKELKEGNPKGLKLRCTTCGSNDHLTRDCPMGGFEEDESGRSHSVHSGSRRGIL